MTPEPFPSTHLYLLGSSLSIAQGMQVTHALAPLERKAETHALGEHMWMDLLRCPAWRVVRPAPGTDFLPVLTYPTKSPPT